MGSGSEISNFFGARGRGVGGSGEGVIDKSGKRLSCSLELNKGVVQDIELACVITGLFVSARNRGIHGEGVGGGGWGEEGRRRCRCSFSGGLCGFKDMG